MKRLKYIFFIAAASMIAFNSALAQTLAPDTIAHINTLKIDE
ncbi:MAG TPA: hypothetical protein VFE53_21225 [Mucilaginibacter sp.]|jgi:hypothetical protein|nr:hypothetical protein [Mucilaginibacter sp.]